ncbi:protein ASPARTIC PROTEASE IN GUARD CELL 1-like [Mangifera indica]|uniref:protein ASPARTIC PROTEASE IN GUARD CELL 1-like n=1 Tax=Mangifera indica TaxID=29780 RepID=UPI001CFA9E75|nr:protein ASPARTIC PROTEASE IN GUARD CELL 1-like [Mangifera indica]
MATTKPFFLFTLLFFFSLLISFTFSRTIPSTTSPLNVSSALKLTTEILNTLNAHSDVAFQPFAQETIQQPFLNSSSFSFPIHSREILDKTQYKDYKTLLQSRLERDSARVNSLVKKLRRALNKDEVKSTDNQMLTQGGELSAPLVSGESQGSGEYFTRIGVGSPAEQFYMVIDTGSDVNWIQCKPCVDCYEQSDPLYDPSASSSYKSLSCNSPQCDALDVSACLRDQCLYEVTYGDGSFTAGNLMTETLSFGKSGYVESVTMGCGHDNQGLFTGAAGLLGLGGGSLSLPKQLKTKSFSYCLVNRDSNKTGTLEFNSPVPSDSVTTMLSKSNETNTFYYVGLTGFTVGGHKVQIPESTFELDESGNGGIIIDCGTAVSRLQTPAYHALRDAFRNETSDLKSTGPYSLFDTCYDLSGLSTVKVPSVSFVFAGNKYLDLPTENYLIPVDSDGTFCFAFASTDSSPQIIGNVQQQGTRVTFDLANERVGFASYKC